jgi:drug/metabolite transporter (DMT)-like permease
MTSGPARTVLAHAQRRIQSAPTVGALSRGNALNNTLLFLVPALIWGSTWLAIRYQLGVVDPLVSVSYRFLAAGGLLLLYCRARRVRLRFGLRDQAFVALQGLLLFGLSYWVVYLAELDLPSGLVAVVYSGVLFANVINARLFLKSPIRRRVVLGGLLGLAGIGLIFADELAAFSLSNSSLLALGLAAVGVQFSSLGNILSARNQRAGMTVLQSNTLSMLYGSLSMLALSVLLGKPLAFEPSFRYVASFAYLVVFGSIIAFACFLTLLGRIGADRAGYVALLMPVIALALTTVFERYAWTPAAIVGAALVLLGNYLALRRT